MDALGCMAKRGVHRGIGLAWARGLGRTRFAPSALDALSVLLKADLPWSPTTEQLIEVRQDLARVEVEALNGHPRAAFDKLVSFLDMAIRHAKDCEGNPRRRSSTNFRWHGEN